MQPTPAKGKMEGSDGHKKYTLKAGEYCIVRKNQLARYNKQKDEGQFEKVVIVLGKPNSSRILIVP